MIETICSWLLINCQVGSLKCYTPQKNLTWTHGAMEPQFNGVWKIIRRRALGNGAVPSLVTGFTLLLEIATEAMAH